MGICGGLSSGCVGDRSREVGNHNSGLPDKDRSFTAFWIEFQSAGRGGDADRVAALTVLPMPKGDSFLLRDVSDKAGFRRAFERLFRSEAREKILSTSAAAVSHDETAPGKEEWRISYIHDDEVSEAEWAIFYHFAPTPDGIRLVGIFIAG